jgi:hypothetical protein
MSKHDVPVLLPQPRTMKMLTGKFIWQNEIPIVCHGSQEILLDIAEQLNDAILTMQKVKSHTRFGQSLSAGQRGIILSFEPSPSVPPQGYRLSITPDQIRITSTDGAGLFYGSKTLIQLMRQFQTGIPACEVDDHPDFPVRGVMLDISRDKVPTLETLFELIDELAEWKINHLELYTEHTFAYRNHSQVWAQASPMTGEDILRLDAYCRQRFIELVPNQNSFGHMSRWLSHPQYKELSECPNGFDCEWGHFDEPFSFDPTNRKCLELIDELYDELLPNFTSRKFNVGCDETVDLGLGKSKSICEQKGKGRVYLEFLLKINELVKRHGRIMHFWGDIILKHPELVSELPEDITVLEWGYEADHPFDEDCGRLASTGIPFYVCPGTSTWRSIAGRSDNCIKNLRSAAKHGLKHGAKGFLNTDWGDFGHWQYQPVSYFGFAAGAGLSWCYEVSKEKDFIAELNLHVFKDSAGIMGRLAYDLGNAYLKVDCPMHNNSALTRILYYPDNPIPEAITAEKLLVTQEYIQTTLASLNSARMDRKDASLIIAEYQNTGKMLLAACNQSLAHRQGIMNKPNVRNELVQEMRTIMGMHAELWMQRNRVGGLFDSMKRLEKVLNFIESKAQ